MADYAWRHVQPRFTVDHEPDVPHHGTAGAVARRIVRKTDEKVVHHGLVRFQPPLEAIAGPGALVYVLVHPIETYLETTQIHLGSTAQKQVGIVGKMGFCLKGPIDPSNSVLGPLLPRCQTRDLQIGCGNIQTHAVVVHFG